jgi:hypothetical protein
MKNDTSNFIDLDSILESKSETKPEIIPESAIATASESTTPDIETILTEWAWRCDKGYPVWGDVNDMKVLQQLLHEMKVDIQLIDISQLNESTALAESNTPDMKESLAIFFSTLSSKSLDSIQNKIISKSDVKLSLKVPNSASPYYGSKGFALLNSAVDYLNLNVIDTATGKLYLNAISIARQLQKTFGGPVLQSVIDRGRDYNVIRSNAKKVSGVSYPDKWCPADIYIYNDNKSKKIAQSAKTLNVGENSLNAAFSTEFGPGAGIVGISLKEQGAQAGKATAFRQILNRNENYPAATELSSDDKYTMELLYNLNQSVTPTKPTPDKLKIGYIAEAVRLMDALKIDSSNKLRTSLQRTLDATFNNKSNAYRGPRGNYNKDAARKSFADMNLSSIKFDPKLKNNIDAFAESIHNKAETVYKDSRKTFLSTLNNFKFKVTGTNVAPSKMSAEVLYKKASCYMVADYLLNGLNSSNLIVPKEYVTLASQKNAFVALTSYAIGQSGISPTFFKLTGKSNGSDASVEAFYGSGFMDLEAGSMNVIDSPNNKGFDVRFNAMVRKSPKTSSEILTRYAVLLSFRYAGDTLNIEVSELKEV